MITTAITEDVKVQNEQLCNMFMEWKKPQVSENTYRGIVSDCKAILQYLDSHQLPLEALPDGFAEYLAYMTENNAVATVKRRICTLRALLDWGMQNGHIPNTPITHIADGLPVPEPKFVDASVMQTLYQYCRHVDSSEDYVIARGKIECLLVILCGYKSSELQSMKRETLQNVLLDCDFVEDAEVIKRSMCNYLMLRDSYASHMGINSDYLFITRRGATVQQLNVDFQRVCDECGLSEGVTLSAVRNAFMRYVSDDNADKYMVRTMKLSAKWVHLLNEQGCSDKRVLKLYNGLPKDKQQEVVDFLEKLTEEGA